MSLRRPKWAERTDSEMFEGESMKRKVKPEIADKLRIGETIKMEGEIYLITAMWMDLDGTILTLKKLGEPMEVKR